MPLTIENPLDNGDEYSLIMPFCCFSSPKFSGFDIGKGTFANATTKAALTGTPELTVDACLELALGTELEQET